MKKKLFLSSNFLSFNGPNNKLLDLCNNIDRKNLDFLLGTHQEKMNPIFKSNIKFPFIQLLKGSFNNEFNRLIWSPYNIATIKRHIKKSEIDDNNIFVNSSIDTLYEAYMATGKKIIVGHNSLLNDINSLFYNFLDKIATQKIIKKIMANTMYQKGQYLKLGIPEKNISVIPTCIDIKRIEKMSQGSNCSQSNFTIFYAGRFVLDKGLITLLSIYNKIIKRYDVNLYLIGKGPLFNSLINEKNSLMKENKNIRIVISNDWLTPNLFLNYLKSSNVMVLPSKIEWCPMIMLESMVLKTPVIASNVGGISETIEHKINGMLYQLDNNSALCNLIEYSINNSEEMKKMGKAAYNTIKNKHDAKVVSPKFENFIH